MSTDTITYTGTLATEDCPTCGMTFAMPVSFRQKCLENRGPNGFTFCCPQGHRQWYVGKTGGTEAPGPSGADRGAARTTTEKRAPICDSLAQRHEGPSDQGQEPHRERRLSLLQPL